jgi:hypothetical protein
LDVGAAAGVPARAGQDDGVQGAVRVSVATAVEPAAMGLA